MSIVLPGEHISAQHVNLKLGPGLLQVSDSQQAGSIISTRAGTLNHSSNGSKWWIDSNSRRVSLGKYLPYDHLIEVRKMKYVPAAQESVVGQVVGRSGEGYRVDIGSAHSASLDGLAFEGASKRNKPNLKVCPFSPRDTVDLNDASGGIPCVCPRLPCTQRHGARA